MTPKTFTSSLIVSMFCAACGTDVSSTNDYFPRGVETQIIVYVPYESGTKLKLWRILKWSYWVSKLEGKLEKQSDGLYRWGGHDMAHGGTNFVWYSDRPDVASTRFVQFISKGVLPENAVIGVAEYANEKRTDWTYRIIYPKGLGHYDFD